MENSPWLWAKGFGLVLREQKIREIPRGMAKKSCWNRGLVASLIACNQHSSRGTAASSSSHHTNLKSKLQSSGTELWFCRKLSSRESARTPLDAFVYLLAYWTIRSQYTSSLWLCGHTITTSSPSCHHYLYKYPSHCWNLSNCSFHRWKTPISGVWFCDHTLITIAHDYNGVNRVWRKFGLFYHLIVQ